jgi:ribonuclease D
VLPEREQLPRGMGPLVDLFKVLLKMKCDQEDVAQKLIASSADLEAIAADDNADVAALKGWRREVFGNDAIGLKHGRIALAADGGAIRLMRLDGAPGHQAAD